MELGAQKLERLLDRQLYTHHPFCPCVLIRNRQKYRRTRAETTQANSSNRMLVPGMERGQELCVGYQHSSRDL